MVHADWEIWGPCGGYVAALALRAAGAESPFARPASFFCHYLSVAAFAPVDLVVTPAAGRAHRAGPARRHEPGGPAGARRHGVVGRARWRGSSTRTSTRPTCPIPDDAADVGGPVGPTRTGPPCPSGTTSTSASIDVVGGVAAARPAPADLAHLGAPPAHGDLRRPLGGRGALAHRARRGELAGRARGRTCTSSRPTSRRASTSTPSFQYPGRSSEWLLLDAHSPVAQGGLLSWTGRVWSRSAG